MSPQRRHIALSNESNISNFSDGNSVGVVPITIEGDSCPSAHWSPPGRSALSLVPSRGLTIRKTTQETLRGAGRTTTSIDDVRIGRWVVAPSLNSISSGGRTVRLEPKVMGVLLCLAKRPGETLSKEQLFRAVWPNIIVTEDVLKRCIAELRRAFDDDARDPHIIETISKRGYRLVAPVTARSASPAPAMDTVSDSIVVMPFLNMTGEAENDYFADGITEEIINALAQIADLHVVARSSAFSFKGKHIDPRIVGEQLNVRSVLEGSVRRTDNRLRITAQLVKSADGYHLWSVRYDREMKDVFAIQDEIAHSIARRLQVSFKGEESRFPVKARIQNLVSSRRDSPAPPSARNTFA